MFLYPQISTFNLAKVTFNIDYYIPISIFKPPLSLLSVYLLFTQSTSLSSQSHWKHLSHPRSLGLPLSAPYLNLNCSTTYRYLNFNFVSIEYSLPAFEYLVVANFGITRYVPAAYVSILFLSLVGEVLWQRIGWIVFWVVWIRVGFVL